MQRYRFAPATLHGGGARGTVRLLGEADLDALIACNERVRASTNGLIKRHVFPTRRALRNAELRFVGVEEGGTLRGSMQTRAIALTRHATATSSKSAICCARTKHTRLRCWAYLHAQRDQFARLRSSRRTQRSTSLRPAIRATAPT